MGQGRTHAVAFAKAGFDVVLIDMLEPENEIFKETIELVRDAGGEVLPLQANICSTPEVEAAFAQAWETFGRLDVVVANAGIINFGYTWELSDEQVERALAVNLEGTWRTDKYAAIYMRKQGYGRIINISSVSGLKGTAQLVTYCMTKFGIIGLTKTLALELQSEGRRSTVTLVCPTKVRTPMLRNRELTVALRELNDGQELYQLAGDVAEDEKNPGGLKFLNPEDVTDIVLWLAESEAATKFNGREIVVDRGAML